MTRPFIVPTGGRDTLAAVVKGINGRGASPPWRPASPGGRRLRGMSDRGVEGEAQRDERHGGRRSVAAVARVEDGDAAVGGMATGTGAVAGDLAGGAEDDNAGAA
uniref:DUF834 domain-containing protein n=1 Tax=Oryza meridionalis TaxID=40149 RepID=A0A0E0BYX9_9ORYZ